MDELEALEQAAGEIKRLSKDLDGLLATAADASRREVTKAQKKLAEAGSLIEAAIRKTI